MAEIDKNPKQICFMRHKTQKMLEGLVYDNGDDTIGLQLDKINYDQGYITYTQPSGSGTDDYFTFGSASVDVRLPLTTEGVILVNGSGEEHQFRR